MAHKMEFVYFDPTSRTEQVCSGEVVFLGSPFVGAGYQPVVPIVTTGVGPESVIVVESRQNHQATPIHTINESEGDWETGAHLEIAGVHYWCVASVAPAPTQPEAETETETPKHTKKSKSHSPVN